MTNTERIQANNAELREAIQMAESLPDAGGAADPVIEPLNITENGTYTAPDGVDGYSPVTVNVPIPNGYIFPSGTKTIKENGTHDAREFESVDVNVPIPDGYIQPSGELEVTENGTHDVTAYASVNVNVEASGGGAIDALIDGSITEISSNANAVSQYAFYGCENLKSVRLPMATSVGFNSFYNCRKLQTAHIPKVTTIDSYAFQYCKTLQSADFPLVTSIGPSGFSSCQALKSVNFPLASGAGQNIFSYCSMLLTAVLGKFATLTAYTFYDCANLNTVDLGETQTIQNNAFGNCYRLKAVILRSTTMCSLGNTGAFSKCYHFSGTTNSTYNPDGLQDGYIYVPSALIEDYKAATNWSTYATQFRAIEDYPDICGG